MGMLKTLCERVEQLEERDRLRVSEFAQHESLALERQEALLSTIAVLEERVQALEILLEQKAPTVAGS